MIPQGESPSSSASDVDNLNNQAAVYKPALSKDTSSHVAGYQVVTARNRPNFLRLLDFTQDVYFAMEASRKSQNAFEAADVTTKEAHNGACISSVKRVIDFSFQDVDELVHLVRLAMEAISRSGLRGDRN
ncbi:CW-type Zinc Finger-like protein [Quillaja saponaria]|uniref:CW-type Zinc Finger-like protein n=1 Tax=Quillaja saponaria TaxID=32244 RepID=A0AAD7LCV9_QUISA|nr:CW-type Zinc Finger-like protein [Quillaja saponaria]